MLQVEAAHCSTQNNKLELVLLQRNLFKTQYVISSDMLKPKARQQNTCMAGKASLICSVT